MDHDSQKNIFYHYFYLFIPIYMRKEFQLLKNFKKTLANAPSITGGTGRLIEQNA